MLEKSCHYKNQFDIFSWYLMNQFLCFWFKVGGDHPLHPPPTRNHQLDPTIDTLKFLYSCIVVWVAVQDHVLMSRAFCSLSSSSRPPAALQRGQTKNRKCRTERFRHNLRGWDSIRASDSLLPLPQAAVCTVSSCCSIARSASITSRRSQAAAALPWARRSMAREMEHRVWVWLCVCLFVVGGGETRSCDVTTRTSWPLRERVQDYNLLTNFAF